jgi:ABC-type multidrug transport system ATPase subunit
MGVDVHSEHIVTYTAKSSTSRLVDIQIRDLTVALQWSPNFIQKALRSLTGKSEPAQSHTKVTLDGLSIDIGAGSLTAIVGGSGSGKTTLLTAISQRYSGAATEVSGSITYSSRPWDLSSNSQGEHADIAYAVQDDVLIPQLTVRETLLYAAKLRLSASTNAAQREQRVEQVIRDLGLAGCAYTHIGDAVRKGCSGGEQRRTSIAVQMLTDSPVLVLDEPTTGLDAASALQVVRILKSLAIRGKTVMMTSMLTQSGINIS